MPSLSERLKALGVKTGAKDLPKPKLKSIYSIEKVLAGQTKSTPQGETFVVENHYPLDHQQGHFGISIQEPLKGIAWWAQDNRINYLQQGSLAFLDIETTGLSGGTGTYAFLIGVVVLKKINFIYCNYSCVIQLKNLHN